jgi:DNA-binding protein HU-beta
MNKTQLIDAIAEKTGQSKAAVAAVVNATVEIVQEAVAAGDRVQIIDFGVFERRYREARTARDLRSGATVPVAARHVPAFKPGRGFKQVVGS